MWHITDIFRVFHFWILELTRQYLEPYFFYFLDSLEWLLQNIQTFFCPLCFCNFVKVDSSTPWKILKSALFFFFQDSFNDVFSVFKELLQWLDLWARHTRFREWHNYHTNWVTLSFGYSCFHNLNLSIRNLGLPYSCHFMSDPNLGFDITLLEMCIGSIIFLWIALQVCRYMLYNGDVWLNKQTTFYYKISYRFLLHKASAFSSQELQNYILCLYIFYSVYLHMLRERLINRLQNYILISWNTSSLIYDSIQYRRLWPNFI